jgi:hypothetical protein
MNTDSLASFDGRRMSLRLGDSAGQGWTAKSLSPDCEIVTAGVNGQVVVPAGDSLRMF